MLRTLRHQSVMNCQPNRYVCLSEISAKTTYLHTICYCYQSVRLFICQVCLSTSMFNPLSVHLLASLSIYIASLSMCLVIPLSVHPYGMHVLGVCMLICLSLSLSHSFSVLLSIILGVSLSGCQFICLSVHLSVSSSVCQFICLSVHLSVSSSVCQFICLSVHLSVSSSVCLFICLSVHLYVHSYLYLCICLNSFLSTHLSIFLSERLSVFLPSSHAQ